MSSSRRSIREGRFACQKNRSRIGRHRLGSWLTCATAPPARRRRRSRSRSGPSRPTATGRARSDSSRGSGSTTRRLRYWESRGRGDVVLSLHAPLAAFMGHVDRARSSRWPWDARPHGRSRSGVRRAADRLPSRLLLGRERERPSPTSSTSSATCASGWSERQARPLRRRGMGRVRDFGTIDDVLAIAAAVDFVRPVLTSPTCTRRATAPSSTRTRSPSRWPAPTRCSSRRPLPHPLSDIQYANRNETKPSRTARDSAGRAAARGARPLRATRDRDQRVAGRRSDSAIGAGARRELAEPLLVAQRASSRPRERWNSTAARAPPLERVLVVAPHLAESLVHQLRCLGHRVPGQRERDRGIASSWRSRRGHPGLPTRGPVAVSLRPSRRPRRTYSSARERCASQSRARR